MADELLSMFQSITTADHDELVDQFAHLLALDTNTATFFLESSNWNVETAVNNYLATMEPALFHDHVQQQQQVDDLAMDDDDDDQQLQQQHQQQPSRAASGYEAQFISDLSAAQTTLVPPSTLIEMFVNTGATPWPADTHLVFAQGDTFDGPVQLPVQAVAPGARIDLSVRLRTPPQMGAFSGSWRLVSTHGPIGEPFWLVLNVGPSKHEALEPASGAGMGVAAPAAMGGGPSGVVSNHDDDMMDL